MPSTLSKLTVILIFCLFSYACGTPQKKDNKCDYNKDPRFKPDWAIKKLPTDGEGAVGCSSAPFKQEEKAFGDAIDKLAREKGVEVRSKLNTRDTESSSTATMLTSQETQENIKSKTHCIWSHLAGVETCVWLKEIE